MNLLTKLTMGVMVTGLLGLATSEASAQWWNPEIYNSGDRVSGIYYDPFTGRVTVRTDRTRIRESALDPDRNFADPGSRRYVDRIETDAYGVTWRVRGWQWTSNGMPHGDLTRTRINGTGIPGVDHQENDRVLYSRRTDAGPNNLQPNNTQPNNSPRRSLPGGLRLNGVSFGG